MMGPFSGTFCCKCLFFSPKRTKHTYLGVSENRDTPKWMVYDGKPYCLMDDLGGKPTIFGNIQIW